MYAGQINSLSKSAANSDSAVDLLISADAYKTVGGTTKNFTFKVAQGNNEGVAVKTDGTVTITVNAKETGGRKYTAADIAALLSNATISDGANKDAMAEALNIIKRAINYVSDVRGTLGATQNRLDHTINNLSVMQENIQDAESTIRDTDVADEMMAYTKNNILIQSAQAMLAQANQVPQGVLQLLQ